MMTLRSLLLYTACALCLLTSEAACVSGWTEIEGGCFKYFQGGATAANAKDQCMAAGAHLATIETATQNTAAFEVSRYLVK